MGLFDAGTGEIIGLYMSCGDVVAACVLLLIPHAGLASGPP